MRAIVKLGEKFWRRYVELRYDAAVIGTVLYFCVRKDIWQRATRDLLARQILEVGVESMLFVSGMAVMVGISVVVELAFWTREAGQSRYLGPLLIAVVARELGPLLTNAVVIVRTSSATATGLGVLKISGELRDIESQGADTFVSLIMPRVVAVALSTFCLTVIFILVAFASGYCFGTWLGPSNRNLWSFTDSVFNSLRPQDMISIFAKSILPALYTSATSCVGGLSAESVADLPSIAQAALSRSVIGLFVMSLAMSLLTYW